jgi:phosphatidylinositol alpha-1,6-mannosyltransferase
MRHIFLSQRYLPERGGSIEWLRQICKFWPERYLILTHDYKDLAQSPAEVPSSLCLAERRGNIQLANWGLLASGNLQKLWRAFRLLSSSLLSFEPNQVYCSKLYPEALPAVLMKLLGYPLKVIVFMHGEELLAYKSSRELTLVAKFLATKVDLFVCNSLNTKKLLLQSFPALSELKVGQSYPGIINAHFKQSESKSQLRQKYNLPDSAKILVTVARLTKRKNQSQVITAMSNLTNVDVHYLIIGTGPEEQALRDKAQALGLSERIHFMGNVSDEQKAELLSLADIMLMPTVATDNDIEGFGIALLEGQACGLPVICGNTGGESEAVLDGYSGFIIDGNDTSQLLSKLQVLLEEADLYNSMSSNARIHAAKFDAEALVARLYQDLCNAGL